VKSFMSETPPTGDSVVWPVRRTRRRRICIRLTLGDRSRVPISWYVHGLPALRMFRQIPLEPWGWAVACFSLSQDRGLEAIWYPRPKGIKMSWERVGLFSSWLFGLLNLSAHAFAQQTSSSADQNPSQGSNLSVFNPIANPQFWLTMVIIACGLVFVAGQIYFLKTLKTLSADDVIRNCSITIVVVVATILIVAGYNSQQTAQASGLFGTIIGYLLGRSAGRAETRRRDDADE
jgi:hypothetical protein